MDDRIRVKHPNGFEGDYIPKIADILLKRKGYSKVGEGKAAPSPSRETKKVDRKALVKQAIEMNLGTKEELVALSDSELVQLVGKDD